MWIKDKDGDLHNLANARKIYRTKSTICVFWGYGADSEEDWDRLFVLSKEEDAIRSLKRIQECLNGLNGQGNLSVIEF